MTDDNGAPVGAIVVWAVAPEALFWFSFATSIENPARTPYCL